MNNFHLKNRIKKSKEYQSLSGKLKSTIPESNWNVVQAFDRQNKPLSMALGQILLRNPYKIVAKTRVKNYSVSTVWLGINYSFDSSVDIVVFESATITNTGDIFVESRYKSEWEAVIGHCKLVAEMMGDKPLWVDKLEAFQFSIDPGEKISFANRASELRMMIELVGEKLIIEMIGQDLPRTWSRRKRKKVAKELCDTF